MSDSILTSTKEKLGIVEEYTVFDSQIIDFINGVFSTLLDLGVGPSEGFSIADDAAIWEDFLAGDARLQDVPTYLYLRVRMMFDPPPTSYAQESFNKQILAHEYRLMARIEEEPIPVDEEIILEGGEP